MRNLARYAHHGAYARSCHPRDLGEKKSNFTETREISLVYHDSRETLPTFHPGSNLTSTLLTSLQWSPGLGSLSCANPLFWVNASVTCQQHYIKMHAMSSVVDLQKNSIIPPFLFSYTTWRLKLLKRNKTHMYTYMYVCTLAVQVLLPSLCHDETLPHTRHHDAHFLMYICTCVHPMQELELWNCYVLYINDIITVYVHVHITRTAVGIEHVTTTRSWPHVEDSRQIGTRGGAKSCTLTPSPVMAGSWQGWRGPCQGSPSIPAAPLEVCRRRENVPQSSHQATSNLSFAALNLWIAAWFWNSFVN